MTVRQLQASELQIDPTCIRAANVWLGRGDGIAVYENKNLGSIGRGHRQYLSVGSEQAQFECSADELPTTLPDIGGAINWRYKLVGVYSGDQLQSTDERGPEHV